MQLCNSSLHVHEQRRGVLNYCKGHNEVRLRPGQKASLAPVFEPEVFRKQMYCTEVHVTLLVIFGGLIVMWESCPLRPVVTPLVTACSDASQQIMVHNSNQRHTKTLGFRRGKIFNSPEFLRHWGNTNWRILQGDGSVSEAYPKISGRFSEFFKSCPNLPLTSYAYSFNAETLAKY